MRAKERIKPIIKFFNENPTVLSRFLGDEVTTAMFDTIYEGLPHIRMKWLKNPDQRLGQLLVNLNFLPHFSHLFFTEEVGWLVNDGYMKFEDINFWGVNYFKNGKRRAKTKFVVLKDLKDDHIAAILKHAEDNSYNINSYYYQYFKERLRVNEEKENKMPQQ